MTNAAATLEDLVAPLAATEFLLLLRERKLALVRADSPDRYSTLLNWEALLRMIEAGEYPRRLGDLRLSKQSVTVPLDRWLTKSKTDNTNKIDIAKVKEYMAKGFSLIVMPIQQHAPSLTVLCDSIKSRLGEQIRAGVIVTTGAAGAFKLHYDPEDLIILQVEGTKRWRLYGPVVSNPVIDMPRPAPPTEPTPIFDEILTPGDLLFLPAGTWHHCENGPDRSLHLGIFFVPPTGWDALKSITSQLLRKELFRTPLTRLSDSEDLEALENDIKIRVIEKIGQLKLNDFLTEWSKKTQ